MEQSFSLVRLTECDLQIISRTAEQRYPYLRKWWLLRQPCSQLADSCFSVDSACYAFAR